jgi:hypothetical protein
MTGQSRHVVEGDVLVGERVALPARRPKHRRWRWVLAAVVAGVLALAVWVPAVWIGLPIIRDTLAAGRGASTPTVALVQWMYSFEHEGRDGQLLADRNVVKSQRATVRKVRDAFMAARSADVAAHPEVSFGPLAIGSAPGGAEAAGSQEHDGRADVLLYVKTSFRYNTQATLNAYNSPSLPWRAEARYQGDGWRLWSVAIPPWCGRTGDATSGYARCDG